MKKISVIVPVYNAEACIGQCVRSLTGQTYQDQEILLIDDGSADRSLEICGALARTDSRIKVFHQENKGVSAARNRGLDIAAGDCIFFLDSDDAIHPLLFEEMIRQMEERHVEMAFCGHARMDGRQMDEALAGASVQDRRPRWQVGDGAEAERWFHIDHASVLCGVSGMASRGVIGSLRFDETLSFGEDTVFKYWLFRKQAPAAWTSRQWYYYRTKPKSPLQELMLKDAYTEKTVRIRDSEYQRGNIEYALVRETELSCQLRQRYEVCRKRGSKDQCRQIKASALRECGHPLFRSVDPLHKGLFRLCFKCYPLYVPVSRVAGMAWTLRSIAGERRRSGLRRQV